MVVRLLDRFSVLGDIRYARRNCPFGQLSARANVAYTVKVLPDHIMRME